MVDSGARELGTFIANLANSQSQTRENLTGDDATGGLLIYGGDDIVIDESATVTSREITGIFIVEHPIYGEVSNDLGTTGYPVGTPLVLDHPVYGFLDDSFLGDDITFTETILYEYNV